MANIKYAYFRDGDIMDLVYRVAMEGDYETAYIWDYKTERWLESGGAWDGIDDHIKRWALNEDYVDEYIQEMLKEFPSNKDTGAKPNPKGARRKRKYV